MSEKYFLLDDKARQANGFMHDCTIWKEWKRKLSPMRWLDGSGHSTTKKPPFITTYMKHSLERCFSYHSLLSSSFKGLKPIHLFPEEELGFGYILVWPFRIIHDTHLNDKGSRDRFRVSEERGAATRTEAIGYLVSRVGKFWLWSLGFLLCYQRKVLET
jgi:hypothetical protein